MRTPALIEPEGTPLCVLFRFSVARREWFLRCLKYSTDFSRFYLKRLWFIPVGLYSLYVYAICCNAVVTRQVEVRGILPKC